MREYVVSGEIYAAGKHFRLPPIVTVLTNLISVSRISSTHRRDAVTQYPAFEDVVSGRLTQLTFQRW